MDMDSPKISVIMPVYRGDVYLSEAVQSILCQTYTNFNFLILCDDPSDETRNILDTYQHQDSRLRVYYQKDRLGLVGSLNYGISLATGEYIARMDADDISLPQRFEEQVAYMDSRSEIGICGTWVKTLEAGADSQIWRYPLNDHAIRCELLFYSALAHPTVFIRREIVNRFSLGYDDRYPHAEDYKFWVNASNYTKLANIPMPLLYHRLHKNSVSQTQKSTLIKTADTIRSEQLFQLGINPTNKEREIHQQIFSDDLIPIAEIIQDIESWLALLVSKNSEKRVYPEPEFSKLISHRWYHVCRNATGLGEWIWKKYWSSTLVQYYSPKFEQKVIFALRSKSLKYLFDSILKK